MTEGVILDKAKIDQYVEKFQLVYKIEIPEDVREKLGCESSFIRVRGASLDDHIKARELSSAPMMLLATIVDKASKGEEIDVDMLKGQIYSGENLHPNTNFEIEIFASCVIEPKFTVAEVIKLSQVMPEFVNKVVNRCLEITSIQWS